MEALGADVPATPPGRGRAGLRTWAPSIIINAHVTTWMDTAAAKAPTGEQQAGVGRRELPREGQGCRASVCV